MIATRIASRYAVLFLTFSFFVCPFSKAQETKATTNKSVQFDTKGITENPSHIIDSRFYQNGFSTAEMREVFSDLRRYQRWLDVEVGLAKVQSELGIIPKVAAEEIAQYADIGQLEIENIQKGIQKTGHSLVPLLREVQRNCTNGGGEYIHYGATTQDIEDTGAILEMRDAYDIVYRDLITIATILSDLAMEHKNTIMAGRTHGQQAAITTFGYKVATWLDEVMRHIDRMEDAKSRIFKLSMYGAVGTMSAYPKGMETSERLAEHLGLYPATASWHTSRDMIAEYVSMFSMIATTMGKVTNEIYVHSQSEFSELAEPHRKGQVGSSTMPHKINPEVSEQVTMLARLTKYYVPMAIESMVNEHDRDGRSWRMDWISIPEVSLYTAAALKMSIGVLDGLQVRKEKMAENLRLQKDFLFSEAFMIDLGKDFGKQTAHEIVYQASMKAQKSEGSIIDFLLKTPEVIEKGITKKRLEGVANPERHLGFSVQLTEKAIEKARQKLAKVSSGM